MSFKLLKDSAIFLIVFFLANCTALPKPFEHNYKKEKNVLVTLKGGGAVRVEIDPNLPEFISKPLSMYTVKALLDSNIPASADPNFFSNYILRSSLIVERPNETHPEQATFVWRLVISEGAEVGEFRQMIQGGEAGWLNTDSKLFSIIAEDATRQLEGYLQENKSLAGPTSRTFAESGSELNHIDKAHKFFLSDFSGATDTGNSSILRSLKFILNREPGFLISKEQDANYSIQGVAKISKPINDSCEVAITWFVTSSDGEELGKITQSNNVTVDSLTTFWDQTALSIAHGAFVGIKNIVDNSLNLRR